MSEKPKTSTLRIVLRFIAGFMVVWSIAVVLLLLVGMQVVPADLADMQGRGASEMLPFAGLYYLRPMFSGMVIIFTVLAGISAIGFVMTYNDR